MTKIIKKERAGEMTQWLRVLAALAEDVSLVPSIHRMTYNHL